jgi:hypothetical protein
MAPAPQLAQVLLRGQDDALAALGIARLVHDEHAARMRPQKAMRLPLLQPSAVERLGVGRAHRACAWCSDCR